MPSSFRPVATPNAGLNTRAGRTLALLVFVASPLAGGCDPQADPARITAAAAGGTGGRASRAGSSGALESCAATADCAEGLRCVASVCRSSATSRLGEYRWAAGSVLAAKGEQQAAAEAYQQAVAAYEAEQLEVPAELLCDHGAALRRDGDASAAEQAARLLHRCLLETPSGAPARRAALRELAELELLGLDPALLARDAPADRYLVQPPRKPAADRLAIEVARVQPTGDRGYEAWAKVLEGDAARAQLLACYDRWFEATQRFELEVRLPLKLRVRIGDDDEIVGGNLQLLEGPGTTGDEAAAARCVREGLASLAADFGKRADFGRSWTGAVTVRVAPRGR